MNKPNILNEILGLNDSDVSTINNTSLEEIDPKQEHVVGTASILAQKLCILKNKLIDEYNALLDTFFKAKITPTDDEIKSLYTLDHHIKATNELMWCQIYDEFDLHGKPSIGLRKDWQVVWREESEEKTNDKTHSVGIIEIIKYWH